jgi:hypothetical protein
MYMYVHAAQLLQPLYKITFEMMIHEIVLNSLITLRKYVNDINVSVAQHY